MIQKIFLNNQNSKFEGSVLLLALLVMSTIMAASVGLASIVISEIRQSRSMDNAILAYYGAESGVEESLYKIRKEKKPIDELVVEKKLGNDVDWYIKSGDITNMVDKISVPELKKDQFIEIDIYDPSTEEDTKVKLLELTLLELGEEDNPNFEVSWFGWKGGILSNYKTICITRTFFTEDDGDYKYVIDLAKPFGEPQFAYRIKVKALYYDINLLEIKAYDSAEELVNMPARIKATVRGEYRGSRQSIDFEMPRQSPLGGLFDFVLFSEESIIKGAVD